MNTKIVMLDIFENGEKVVEPLGIASITAVLRSRGFCTQLFAYNASNINRINFSSIEAVKDYTENDSGLLMKSLKGETFRQFEKDPRMVKLIEMLKPVAII